MEDRKPDFSKCKAYSGYCGKFGKCIAEQQAESDVEIIGSWEDTEAKDAMAKQVRRYVRVCTKKGCAIGELLKEMVAQLK